MEGFTGSRVVSQLRSIDGNVKTDDTAVQEFYEGILTT